MKLPRITLRNMYCSVTVFEKTPFERFLNKLEYDAWVNLRKKWKDPYVHLAAIEVKTVIEANEAYERHFK